MDRYGPQHVKVLFPTLLKGMNRRNCLRFSYVWGLMVGEEEDKLERYGVVFCGRLTIVLCSPKLGQALKIWGLSVGRPLSG